MLALGARHEIGASRRRRDLAAVLAATALDADAEFVADQSADAIA